MARWRVAVSAGEEVASATDEEREQREVSEATRGLW